MQDSPAAQPFISLHDVAIRLGDRPLFQHTTWELRSDQHWAVLGPNGSGKSTLMKALCGQLPVVQGEIVYHFAAPASSAQQSIAYVAFDAQRSILAPQDPFHQARWHSDQSREGKTLEEFLWPDGDALAPPAHDEVLWPLELEGLLDRTMLQLSNGERRKAFIARALLRAPKGAKPRPPRLLILDNPFTGLDHHSRAGLRAAVQRLIEQGDVRVILVGAESDELPAGITHVLRVEAGQVVAQERTAAAASWSAAARDAARVLGSAGGAPKRRPGPVLVHLAGVRVAYNGTTVLDGVDWTVRQGEHWALVGPNGAGKTTLLSLLLGDHPQAYANTITLFGRRRGTGETIWEIKQQVGWVAPELHLYYPPDSSCLDVVCSGLYDSVGLYRRPTPAERALARASMERLGIGAWADPGRALPFARLSEGEQRMVLVARALAKQPRLLVLDEPCQGLDARNQQRVLEAVDTLGQQAADAPSVIYVTHDGVFPTIVTHVLRLERGRVVACEQLQEPSGCTSDEMTKGG